MRLSSRLATATLTAALLASCSANLPTPPIAPVHAVEGLGLKGYDPVPYRFRGEPAAGSSAWTFHWQVPSYRFASEDTRDLFASDPV